MDHSEFTCPQCGSHMFGSSNCTGPGPVTRHCHGYKEVALGSISCSFSWPESEDAKYGLKPPEQMEGVGQSSLR